MGKLRGLRVFADSVPETIADKLARKVITIWTLERNGRTPSILLGELGNNVNAQLLREVDEQ